MKSRLVFITQAYDPAATILGVTRDWVAALARRCDGVDVIAGAAPAPRLGPAGVRVASLGKERGVGRAGQTLRLARALATSVPRAGAVFVHMVPRLVLLAYPFAALARRPLALWYAQGGLDPSLRLASRLASHILTPTRDSFPLRGAAVDRRLTVTGHGVDTARYAPDATPPATPPRMLAAGRLSPSKRYALLLKAAARLPDLDWRLRIAGPPLYPSDRAHAATLQRLAADLGIADLVEFAGDIPYQHMPAEYRAAWVLAHTSATGSLDKVVLEAMACGTPVLSTAASSRTAFGALADTLWCPDESPEAVAGALANLLHWSPARRLDAGMAARAVVERDHSLDTWAQRVVRLLGVG
jgi:glycosyltransferase involved in cell wall biosynthesis